MLVKPLRTNLITYLIKHTLKNKFDKQIDLFVNNPRHTSLNTEGLEPKHLKVYSFRIDRKYSAIFIFISPEEIEIIDINDHYQ